MELLYYKEAVESMDMTTRKCRRNWARRSDLETARLLEAEKTSADSGVPAHETEPTTDPKPSELLRKASGRIIEPMLKWLP